MKNKLFVVVLGAVLSVTASAQKIVIKGSDTLGAKMVPQLAEAYKAGGEKASFEIAAEGSSQAFSALLAKAADIGMSSRDAKDEEKNDFIARGRKLVEHVAAFDMIAVIMQQATRVSTRTAFFYLGELIEYDETAKIFGNPSEKQTEDYVTGRFG